MSEQVGGKVGEKWRTNGASGVLNICMSSPKHAFCVNSSVTL